MHGRRTNVSDPLARGQCAASSRRKACGNVVFVFFMAIRIPHNTRTVKQKKKEKFTARENRSCFSARRAPQLQAPLPRGDSPIKTEALRCSCPNRQIRKPGRFGEGFEEDGGVGWGPNVISLMSGWAGRIHAAHSIAFAGRISPRVDRLSLLVSVSKRGCLG